MSHYVGIWLLPIFFALIGIELRNEIQAGSFIKKRTLLIPFTAATFGVLVPFLIYELFVSLFSISNSGWGVVVATDLPLALLALKLFHPVAQNKLRPYLLSLAIFDDLISILLIALVYHQNGVHPTVYGFILGFLLPVSQKSRAFDYLNKLSNFFVLPIFVITSIIENFSFKVGILTIAVLIARMGGKPLGIFIGDLLASSILKHSVINTKEVLAIGALATLGLSVSLLFADISGAPKIAVASILILIPVALIRIKVLSRTFMQGDF